jgi:transcriptional regulator with XRE-family HTH domain
MKNALARQILAETPADVKQFVRRYSELTVRIHDILEEKGWTQKDLAEKMGKSPSEISKWLNGEHNFTIRSLTKLEVELGVELIQIPKYHKFQVLSRKTIHLEITQPTKFSLTKQTDYTKCVYQNIKPFKSSIA